jgi:hypothetical protein
LPVISQEGAIATTFQDQYAGVRQAHLVESGETSPMCVFETIAGDTFSVARPLISREQEASLVAELREILEEEGGTWR